MIPTQLVKGDSLNVLLEPESSQSGAVWDAASFTLQSKTQADLQVTGSADFEGTSVRLQLTPSQTQAMPVGLFLYQVKVTNAAEAATVVSGLVLIFDPLDTTRSFAEEMVELLEGILKAKLQNRKDIKYYLIGDRQASTFSPEELRMEIRVWKDELERERGDGHRYWKQVYR